MGSHFQKKAAEIWQSIITGASEMWDNITNKAAESWDNVKKDAGEKWNSVTMMFKNAWQNLSIPWWAGLIHLFRAGLEICFLTGRKQKLS